MKNYEIEEARRHGQIIVSEKYDSFTNDYNVLGYVIIVSSIDITKCGDDVYLTPMNMADKFVCIRRATNSLKELDVETMEIINSNYTDIKMDFDTLEITEKEDGKYYYCLDFVSGNGVVPWDFFAKEYTRQRPN